MPGVKIRSVFFLFICLTNVALAGEFQKTQDGKTWVWNNNPRPGDQATWSGQRDEKGYASGKGTLTWFHTERKIVTGSQLPLNKYHAIASYTGEMAHGKLNGQVSATDSNGKKFHGTFVDGRRKKWAAGAAKEIAQEEPAVARGELIEPPAPAQGPDAEVDDNAPKPAAKSSPMQTNEAKPAAKSKPEFDDSLRSLVGPPTSLRTEPNAPARSTSTSSPAPAASASAEASASPQ
jgi:hypothetical protein